MSSLLQHAAAANTRQMLMEAEYKVDRLKRKDDLLPWIAHYQTETGISAIISVSALKNDGLDKLESYLLDALPESEAIFPRDLHTDQAERLMCEELLREQILLLTHQEVPHSVAVVIESFLDEDPRSRGGLCIIEGEDYLAERDSHKDCHRQEGPQD